MSFNITIAYTLNGKTDKGKHFSKTVKFDDVLQTPTEVTEKILEEETDDKRLEKYKEFVREVLKEEIGHRFVYDHQVDDHVKVPYSVAELHIKKLETFLETARQYDVNVDVYGW